MGAAGMVVVLTQTSAFASGAFQAQLAPDVSQTCLETTAVLLVLMLLIAVGMAAAALEESVSVQKGTLASPVSCAPLTMATILAMHLVLGTSPAVRTGGA
jgi:hypothetical protein